MTGIGVMDYGEAAKEGKLGTNISQTSSSSQNASSSSNSAVSQHSEGHERGDRHERDRDGHYGDGFHDGRDGGDFHDRQRWDGDHSSSFADFNGSFFQDLPEGEGCFVTLCCSSLNQGVFMKSS